MKKDLGHYRALPYGREWLPRDDESGRYFVVRLLEIPEIYGTGFTRQLALSALGSAFDDQIAWCLDMGIDIPEPSIIPKRPLHHGRIAFVKVERAEDAPEAHQLVEADAVSGAAANVESFQSSEPIDVDKLELVA